MVFWGRSFHVEEEREVNYGLDQAGCVTDLWWSEGRKQCWDKVREVLDQTVWGIPI